jgi:NADH:ubiquinone oxidoreductase subunit 5 (subunit L)/multisubunit Na+/H+ antiporter MnhA subunit
MTFELVPWVAVAMLTPVWPALSALLISALLMLTRRSRPLRERTVAAVAQTGLWLSFLCVLAGLAALVQHHGKPLDVRLGHWYKVGDYGFELVFLLDPLSVACALLVSLLLLSTSRFSVNYLHREPGFIRFFLLVLIFGAGMQLLVLGGSLDVLFAGWEIVGLTSVLLVGFFHEQTGPVRAAVRVLVTYRLCDIGLLIAALSMHLAMHTTAFLDMFRALHAPAGHEAIPATLVSLGLVLAAMGKSAMFPVGGWLPRAMEGPTASSAVFYGGLSVHAGVFLLLRCAPILEAAPAARLLLLLIGMSTAAIASLSGQVSADAKTALAYATISQVGLMFVECALGLYWLATFHLLTHALLRYYQFLRTPSTLQDALRRRAAIGMTEQDESAHRWETLPMPLRRFLYRLALERFEVEATLERWLGRPVAALAGWLDALDRRVLVRLFADDPPPAAAPPPGGESGR